ncbi:MAG: tRNA (guanosine(37)-N1)-methyltransferase TrmD [Candidatus Cloacimonadota bacterium]|nr:tRNA (guanosine(37)-N1)-methyltransferase TrmD [Candidatus Cloacimonadota bacterium]
MQIDILTIFPEMFYSPFSHSIIKRAIDKGKLSIDFIDFREFSTSKHHKVDDYPFGGAKGMVLKPEPIFRAVDFLKKKRSKLLDGKKFPLIYLSPHGEKYNQNIANEFSKKNYIALLCGRYKDIDYRIREHLVVREISIGDYILSGGEIPAMTIVDTLARLQEGVLSHFESAQTDSFQDSELDCIYYTRPREFRGHSVPEILLSGNHRKIAEWEQTKRAEFTKIYQERNRDK